MSLSMSVLLGKAINDPDLPIEAVGLYCWLILSNQGRHFNSEKIAAHHKIGRDKARRILRTLSDNGYVELKTCHWDSGQIYKKWVILNLEDGQ